MGAGRGGGMSSDVARAALEPLVAVRRLSVAARTAIEPPIAVQASDEALLALMQTGDTQALGVLFERYARLVLTIAFRSLRDRAEAEDLVQDVFLHLHETCRTYDPRKGAARTWIVHLAYCRAFDRRAYLGRRGFYAGPKTFTQTNALEEASPSLENQVAALVSGERVHRAFNELTEKQRTTLELYFFEGFTLREIARRLGESLENVRHHYYRGMRHLNECETVKSLRGER